MQTFVVSVKGVNRVLRKCNGTEKSVGEYFGGTAKIWDGYEGKNATVELYNGFKMTAKISDIRDKCFILNYCMEKAIFLRGQYSYRIKGAGLEKFDLESREYIKIDGIKTLYIDGDIRLL